METPFELTKRTKISVSSDEKSKLDFSNANKVMESLLGKVKLDDFLETYWEKKPLLIKREDTSFYGSLFALSTMKTILEKNELDYQADVNVCRYKNGEKELLNDEGRITAKDVDKLIDEKQATFQFHHPQRYVDDLWRLMEKMETYFGSLVGSNVYITPPESQGLAPHCDDVEIFVLQLEGKKAWKLYKPMVELSRDYTQDLLQESIGEPMMEVLLEPGDMLYFPRGVIHQCKTEGSGHSTHISISTYQQNTWGDFMNHAVTQAVENALEDEVSIRTGLPINYMSMLGTGKNISQYIEDEEEGEKSKKKHSNLDQEKVKEFKKAVQSHLTKLIDHIDVNTAADAMCADFMASRLPPFGYEPKEDDVDEATMPTVNDKIKIRFPDHVRVVYAEEEDDMDDDDDDSDDDMSEDEEKPAKAKKPKSPKSAKKASKIVGEDDDDDDDDNDADVVDVEPHVKVVHSLENNRFSHMGAEAFEEEPGCVKLHVSFGKAMVELLNSGDFVAVKDLLLDDEDDKLTLASTLLANDLIEVKSG